MSNTIINDYLKKIDLSVKKANCLNSCYMFAIMVLGLLATALVFGQKVDIYICSIFFVCLCIVVCTIYKYNQQVNRNSSMIRKLINYINIQSNEKEMLEYIKSYISYKESVSKGQSFVFLIRTVLMTSLISAIIKGVIDLSVNMYVMCIFVFVVLSPALTMDIPTSKKELYSQFYHKIILEEQARKIENT